METLIQLRVSSKGRDPLVPDEAKRRIVVHDLASALKGKLTMFGFVDEHGHVVVLDEPEHLAYLKQSTRAVFDNVSIGETEPVWDGPVNGRSHAMSLLRYVENQTFHHEIPEPPALWSGSCFLDLVGARFIEGLEPRLFEVLPRLTVDDLPPLVGLPYGRIQPASDAMIRALGACRLRDAASAALAADPELQGNKKPARRARHVVARMARLVGIATDDVVYVLKRANPVVRRHANRPIERAWERATRVRLALEELVREHIERDWCRRMIDEHREKKR
jgi:hypothetical protein